MPRNGTIALRYVGCYQVDCLDACELAVTYRPALSYGTVLLCLVFPSWTYRPPVSTTDPVHGASCPRRRPTTRSSSATERADVGVPSTVLPRLDRNFLYPATCVPHRQHHTFSCAHLVRLLRTKRVQSSPRRVNMKMSHCNHNERKKAKNPNSPSTHALTP